MKTIKFCKNCKKEFVAVLPARMYCSNLCSGSDPEVIERRNAPKRGKMPKNLADINSNKKGEGNPMWGKQTSEAQKQAVRKMVAEIWADPERALSLRKKLSEGQKGEKGSNWQGGRSPKNKVVRRGIEFRLWRESVFARDNWTCQKCKERGGSLHPHHILNFSTHIELRFAIDNGITFCRDCHNEFHDKYGKKNNTQEQLIEFLL